MDEEPALPRMPRDPAPWGMPGGVGGEDGQGLPWPHTADRVALPRPRCGWCSTRVQLLSSTQWLLYTSSWHRSRAVMSVRISTTLLVPSSLKTLTSYNGDAGRSRGLGQGSRRNRETCAHGQAPHKTSVSSHDTGSRCQSAAWPSCHISALQHLYLYLA